MIGKWIVALWGASLQCAALWKAYTAIGTADLQGWIVIAVLIGILIEVRRD